MFDEVETSSDSGLNAVVSKSIEEKVDILMYYDSKQDDASDEGEEDNRLKDKPTIEAIKRQDSTVQRISKRLSFQLTRQGSSVVDSLPESPAGWTILLSTMLSALLGYELKLQKSLTKPPIVFGQIPQGSILASIYERMTATPDCIFSRKIQPSLFVGTRGSISSAMAYLAGGPSLKEEHLRFREIMQSSQDGAAFGIDWEVPWNKYGTEGPSAEDKKAQILHGPIYHPVVIILHGINNDASFGYIRSLQRSFANRGWNAAAMNFRGCGGVPMKTPRGYNAAFTGDLRNLVYRISGRLVNNVALFLVGNSLGANVLTKYLGEEGLSGTLPKCVAGAASLANPLVINSSLVPFPFNIFMGLGVREIFLRNWSAISRMNDPTHRTALRKALLNGATIADLDQAMAPVMVRNEAFYPFALRVGYKNANSYWLDSSSYRLIRYISVPFLNLRAEDDFLVASPNKNKLGFCIANPNVMVAETRCGGHLGWQESPPDSDSAFGGSSWADVACADFFDCIMKANLEKYGNSVGIHPDPNGCNDELMHSETLCFDLNRLKEDSVIAAAKIMSKL